MGRFYGGDIGGKFWFGVQSSNDADFFGVVGEPPNFLEYFFTKEDLGAIEAGVAKCVKALGDNKLKLDAYFALEEPWNEETVSKATKIPIGKVPKSLKWYARLELGQKILDCVRKKGQCSFDAEL